MKKLIVPLLFLSASAVAVENTSEKKIPVSDADYTRDLVSVNLKQVEALGLGTGVFEGTPKVLAGKKAYADNFYATLATKKKYLNKENTEWEIEAIPQYVPPSCDQPQLNRYDAEGCRYINSLFRDLEKANPELAHKSREQVRRGRDVWFKGTFGNQAMFGPYLGRLFGEMPDYSAWLDTRNRDKRFKEFGLIPDPDCRSGSEKTFWLDECDDPHATGILGVRKYLANASEGFDPLTSPYQKDEISRQKRYIIGFACALCHVAYDPTNPPADPNRPEWENLMGGIGNQYLRHGAMFVQNVPEDYFLRIPSDATRPGSVDTSLVSNDFIHNPGTINAIMNTHNRRLFDEEIKNPITGEVKMATTRHVLKGGEDSVGEKLAFLRVFVNTGLCIDECVTDKLPEVGSLLFNTEQKPFDILQCSNKCESWNYTEAKMDDLLAYLLTIGPTYLDKATDVDGTPGASYIDSEKVPAGRKLFIQNCARCHSSKEIPEIVDLNDENMIAQQFDGHIFGGFHSWERELGKDAINPELISVLFDENAGKLHQEVNLAQDWLGNDELVTYEEIGSNRCRSIQTNHLSGHLWDQFSSETYKNRKSSGSVKKVINHLIPWVGGKEFFGQQQEYSNGQGYYRNVSLLSVWSSAPFLHNNGIGDFPVLEDGTPDYTVKGRVKSFEQSMQQLLMSDNTNDPVHRKPEVWRVNKDINVPARIDGKGLLSMTLKKGSPVGYMASVNPHHGAFSTCDDYVENKGHQFGIDLSKDEKIALIEFLKTL